MYARKTTPVDAFDERAFKTRIFGSRVKREEKI